MTADADRCRAMVSPAHREGHAEALKSNAWPPGGPGDHGTCDKAFTDAKPGHPPRSFLIQHGD